MVRRAIRIFALLCAITAAAAGQTVPATRPAGFAALMDQLASPDFQTRENATTALYELGESILPALQAARKDSDPERRRRIESVLRSITDLPPEKLNRVVAEATEAYARGDYETAAQRYALLTRRMRPSLEQCVAHARALQMFHRWSEAAASYLRAADRIDELLAGDPENDPPPQNVNPNGPEGGPGMGWGGRRNGIQGEPGLSDYRRRELESDRAGLILLAGRIQRDVLHREADAVATYYRIFDSVPEFHVDLAGALTHLAADFPRYQKRENFTSDVSRGLQLLNQFLILDELAPLQEKLNAPHDALLTFARVASARLKTRPDGVEASAANVARLLRQLPDLADTPGATAFLEAVPPPPVPNRVGRPTAIPEVRRPEVSAPFTVVETNLGDFKLGPLAVSSLVQLPDQRWCAVLAAGARLYTTFSRDLVTWEAPTLIPHHPLANNHGAALVVENDGTLHLAWFANPFSLHPQSTAGYQLWCSQSKDGREWSFPRVISCDSGSGWPMGSIQWHKTAAGEYRLSWRATAATASSPAVISVLKGISIKPFDRPWPMDPFVTQDAAGAFHLVYQENLKGIASSTSPDGITWADPVLLTQTQENRPTPNSPQLFFPAEGDRFALVYTDWSGSYLARGTRGNPPVLEAPVRIVAQGVSTWVRAGEEIVGYVPGEKPLLLQAKAAAVFADPLPIP